MTAAAATPTPPADGAETLAEIQAEMTALAAVWEQTAPGDAATLLWALEHRAHILSRGVLRKDAAAAWLRTRAQLLTMEAQALADTGRPVPAFRSAALAMKQAVRARDRVTLAHAETIAASVARAADVRVDPARLIALASTRPGGGFGTAIASVARANDMSTDGPAAARDVMHAVTVAEAVDLGDESTGFALTGWDPHIRDAFCGGALAAVGLAAPAAERLDRAAAAFGPGEDGEPRGGVYAMVLLYQARAAMMAGDLDHAEHLTGDALDVAKKRPSAHVAGGAVSLANRALDRGAHWEWIRDRARLVKPAA